MAMANLIEHPITNKSAKIEWIDIAGRIIKLISVKRNEAKTNVDTQTLIQGVYKVVWTDGKNSLTKTVMILR
jgi:Secretion system C-terminal sorting domain